MRKNAFLALLLVLSLVLSGCALIKKDAEVDAATEIIRLGDAAVTKAEVLEMAESPLHDLTLDMKAAYPEARFIPIIADVRNRNRMEEVFSQLRPDVVYHAAAYKHVPLMEDSSMNTIS